MMGKHTFGKVRRAVMLFMALMVIVMTLASDSRGQVLDKQKLLDAQTFWDNRDWDWYKQHIPFFESPDADIDTTYYYRWEVLTKHLVYGSPATGYTFTEFIDRPFWSGAYGSISCPAGHQLYEARWLRRPRIARDFARYWFRTPGAQPRRYSTWLADAVWALQRVHPDDAFTKGLLPDMIRNYEAWRREHFVEDVGLFWQTGHDDGMEININSRQTKDKVRGAPGYRPTLNSYLWADALAIARVADLSGDEKTSQRFRRFAAGVKANLQKKLWDPKRRFFFHMYMRDEKDDGHVVKALSLTHQTGRFADSGHGRELIGYVPWQFGLPDPGYEAAWKYLMDRDYFFADFGPTTTERHDPMFVISDRCCVWSGQSWPYATTQTLKAMANLLHRYKQAVVSKADYVKLLRVYARTHRKAGRPYIAEAANPDTGSWDGHDSYNHSEHYFHSGYVDLIITGLAGLQPRDDGVVEVNPLAPDDWAYFALDDVMYKGRRLSIVWDRAGRRYGFGPGLHVIVNGKKLASRRDLGRLTADLPPLKPQPKQPTPPVDFAVNNDLRLYPRVTASFTSADAPLYKVNDGNYWYHRSPPNRWTCRGTPNRTDWLAVDFGVERTVDTVKLYFLDDGKQIAPPQSFALQYWADDKWADVPGQQRTPAAPTGRRANVVRFKPLTTVKLRAVFTHRTGQATGLTEFEAWGAATLPVKPAPPPPGNLAANPDNKGFPKASASHTSRFDKVEMANDGLLNYRPRPHNRWTAYESPNLTDWLAIDFGKQRTVGRVVLHIYDDRGGVQPPKSYTLQYWDSSAWRDVANPKKQPAQPAGNRANTVTFPPIQTTKVRVVFTHHGQSRSGVSEIEVWKQ